MVEGTLYWDGVIETRKRLQKSAIGRVVFIDQSRINMHPAPVMSLAPRGRPAVVKRPQPAAWEPRFDFMGACSGRQLLALQIKTPRQRREEKVKGWGKGHILEFVRVLLAPAIVEAKISGVTVVIDRACHIKAEEVSAALVEGGVGDAKEVVVLPAGTAKYVSPLDNTLWHEMKQRLRMREPESEKEVVKAIEQEWEAVTPEKLLNYYRHCALLYGNDPVKGRH